MEEKRTKLKFLAPAEDTLDKGKEKINAINSVPFSLFFLMPETIAIEAKELTKIFGTRRAVDGISFSVSAGETFALLGPNGAGKSTTMRMFACRSPLSSGYLRVEGFDAKSEDRKFRRYIGVV